MGHHRAPRLPARHQPALLLDCQSGQLHAQEQVGGRPEVCRREGPRGLGGERLALGRCRHLLLTSVRIVDRLERSHHTYGRLFQAETLPHGRRLPADTVARDQQSIADPETRRRHLLPTIHKQTERTLVIGHREFERDRERNIKTRWTAIRRRPRIVVGRHRNRNCEIHVHAGVGNENDRPITGQARVQQRLARAQQSSDHHAPDHFRCVPVDHSAHDNRLHRGRLLEPLQEWTWRRWPGSSWLGRSRNSSCTSTIRPTSFSTAQPVRSSVASWTGWFDRPALLTASAPSRLPATTTPPSAGSSRPSDVPP